MRLEGTKMLAGSIAGLGAESRDRRSKQALLEQEYKLRSGLQSEEWGYRIQAEDAERTLRLPPTTLVTPLAWSRASELGISIERDES